MEAVEGGFGALLREAAAECGIAPGYVDTAGRFQETAPEVTKDLLSALGVPCGSEAELAAALEERAWRRWSRPLDETVVVSAEKAEVPLRLREGVVQAELRIAFEQGHEVEVTFVGGQPVESRTVRGVTFHCYAMALPRLPLGYHELTLVGGAAPARAALIVCPDRVYPGPGGRTAGIAISLYGLRSSRNWGAGDFTDLENFARWAARETGAGFVALNPLHAIANRQPYNTSPYLPQSAFYRNYLYLDIERIPEFATSRAAQRLRARAAALIEELRASEFVEYERVARLKRLFLKVLFREYLRRRADEGEFQRYVEREGVFLHRYAVFCALDERLHRLHPELWLWTEWPEPYRHPDSAATLAFTEKHWRLVLFFKWVQWQIDRQLELAHRRARQAGMPVGLYHDLALATDRYGADLWGHREAFHEAARVGAPPDDFAPLGQDWSFPPPNTDAWRADGYRFFVELVRRNAAHGGALRIDHVMRFFRLFWIPEGRTAAEGAYVASPAQDLLRILALESQAAEVMVIGEDLGTVTGEIREALHESGILSCKVFYFERDPGGAFRKPWEYPEQAVVCSTTHDLPTFAGFWTGRDIEARFAAGLVDAETTARMREERAAAKQQMLDVLRPLGLLPEWFPEKAAEVPEVSGELHYAVTGFLAMAESAVLVVNQEDLTKETEQQNLPGSTHQYPNWRRKMKYSLEELESLPLLRDCARMFRNWLERSGRAASVRK
jgi:4-alpha-glucanotransferase